MISSNFADYFGSRRTSNRKFPAHLRPGASMASIAQKYGQPMSDRLQVRRCMHQLRIQMPLELLEFVRIHPDEFMVAARIQRCQIGIENRDKPLIYCLVEKKGLCTGATSS